METPRRLLVQQAADITITIMEGEVPVVPVIGASCESEVALIVNLLRSGCPAIQAVLNADYLGVLCSRMDNLLARLELPREHFVRGLSPGSEVVVISRRVDT